MKHVALNGVVQLDQVSVFESGYGEVMEFGIVAVGVSIRVGGFSILKRTFGSRAPMNYIPLDSSH